jgi:hypothetical protein
MTAEEVKRASAEAVKPLPVTSPTQPQAPVTLKLQFYSCGQLESKKRLEGFIRANIEVINKGYRGELLCRADQLLYDPPRANTGIQFKDFEPNDLRYIEDTRCASCDTYYNELWTQHLGPAEHGTISVLICPHNSITIGLTNYPWQAPRASLISVDVMPNGGLKRFSDGKTLVHEMGHYLSLYHTFESCYPGDHLQDTNSEYPAFFGCPSHPLERTEMKTCPQQPDGGAYDPIHNFMDYTDDECMCGFTPLQAKRMMAYLTGGFTDGESETYFNQLMENKGL